MRKLLALSLTMILIGASSGCGPGNSDHTASKTEAEKQQALRNSAFGSAVETMDRAKAVEQLQQDRKNQLDAAMESSEGQ